MRLKPWQIAALVVAAGMFLGATPVAVYNATLLMMTSSCGWAWRTVRAASAPAPPLKLAILRVTSDFHQLASLVAEFLEQPSVDPATKDHFLRFLEERAARSYPRLESALDWLLAVYKFVFPFLIISMVAKLSSGGQDSSGEAGAEETAAEDLAAVEPSGPLMLARRSSQQYSTPAPVLAHANPGAGNGYAHQRPQLAISSSAARAGKGSAAPDARAGSQSPSGPETPSDGSGVRLPVHPAATQRPGSGRAWRQHHPIISEIQEGGF